MESSVGGGRASSAVVVRDRWEVSYEFRGRGHRLQMSAPPGVTVTVNQRGEPRM